jgi:ABC-type transporter Mla MlaB component
MKYKTQTNIDETLIIEALGNKLTLKEVEPADQWPLADQSTNEIIFNLDCIKEVDPAGLSCLINWAKSYKKIGIKVYLEKTSTTILNALEYLGLQSELNSKNL